MELSGHHRRSGYESAGRIVAAFLSAATAAVIAADKPADAPVDEILYGQTAVLLENEHLSVAIGINGRILAFLDRRTGTDYCDKTSDPAIAHVRIGKQDVQATSVARQGDRFQVRFGDTGISAIVRPIMHKRYLIFEVVSLDGTSVEEFTFVDIRLTSDTKAEDPFVGCALALNLKTNVPEIPQPNTRLQASCYPRFGFAGAQVAIIGCPQSELREIMKEAVKAAPELPQSDLGGPWALDAKINKGSYLFNFGGLSEKTVDEWIQCARALGINQIDMHGGSSFRFGDCRPNPSTYPNGYVSLKAVIDRLHEAGLAVGLHTYAFFIAKDCPWVTPVPDPRLAKDAAFTLTQDMTADSTAVPVVESTEDMSTTTAFFIRNSVTLQIDDELITYKGLSKEPPYAFTECRRGVCGTKVAPHKAGARVHHLKECFGLFVPDGDSTLLTEVAAKTAEAYNECGFDMIYLDALDGEDILAGRENGWHYGSKFVFEICKRLKKPAVMEMSTFHHHLWVVRSRMGAWDHPNRGHKRFIDIHCQANAGLRRMFLPGHLGWWAVKTWSGIQDEPTFSDDIEYLCAKCIGTDVGFSVQRINPGNIATPVFQRVARIMKQYEELRHANYFDDSVKAKLAEPGREFTLVQADDGRWRFHPVQYARHKVEGIDGRSNVWSVDNPFDRQPVTTLRIEALMSAKPYNSPDSLTVVDFADPRDLPKRKAAPGVTFELGSTTDKVKTGQCSGVLTAHSSGKTQTKGAWAMAGKTFDPTLDLEAHQGLGVWIHGDGRGEVLNFQLQSPTEFVTRGFGQHYVIVDFTGWRYFELIEMEGERCGQYSWPYGGGYSIYRENVDYKHLKTLTLWYNNLTPNEQTICYLSPVKALPLVKIKLKNPTVTIGGVRLIFPVEMESGSTIEFRSVADCKLYGPKGELIREVELRGDVPILQRGTNDVTFTCDGPTEVNARARITISSRGDPI